MLMSGSIASLVGNSGIVCHIGIADNFRKLVTSAPRSYRIRGLVPETKLLLTVLIISKRANNNHKEQMILRIANKT